MAVKLSSYYWFRNNFLVRALEDKWSMKTFFGCELSFTDRRTLAFLVEVLDGLKEDSYSQTGSPVLGTNVMVANVVEVKDVTSDVAAAINCFYGIFKIMEQYWVWAEMYRQLGRNYDELGVSPPSDVAEAVRYVGGKMRCDKYFSIRPVCWRIIKEHLR